MRGLEKLVYGSTLRHHKVDVPRILRVLEEGFQRVDCQLKAICATPTANATQYEGRKLQVENLPTAMRGLEKLVYGSTLRHHKVDVPRILRVLERWQFGNQAKKRVAGEVHGMQRLLPSRTAQPEPKWSYRWQYKRIHSFYDRWEPMCGSNIELSQHAFWRRITQQST